MPAAVAELYNNLTEDEQIEVTHYMSFLLSRRDALFDKSPLDEYFGCIEDDDAKIMMEASEECRRLEPNEW